MLARIAKLPIAVDRVGAPPHELLALALALRFGLSSYDAAYLELALRLRLPMATVDVALRDAAVASGVGAWRPQGWDADRSQRLFSAGTLAKRASDAASHHAFDTRASNGIARSELMVT